ncbi:MAG: glycosyltransferase family 4 protein [Desulfomonile tiedjei]|nr:glycosyltransferase family 4 protein [Desulfomonile tiedjei]
MVSLARKLFTVIRVLGLPSIALLGAWVIFFPVLWIYARFFPRKSDRVLFWTNEGFRVAPSRLRCYGFCAEMKKRGADASVLSFWDHIAHYKGLPPFEISLFRRILLLFNAMMAAVHSRAGILFAQRPFYEFLPLLCLKIMYPFSLKIWTDVDDWIYEYSLGSYVNFRDTLPVHTLISEGCVVSSRHLEQEMHKHYNRVEIIPTFPDATMFQPSTDSKPGEALVVFAWTGTLFMEMNLKDVVFLIRAFELLKDDRAVLEIVGAGHFLDEAKREADKIAKHANVAFLGWREPETMPDYYAGIDVGLYPLTTHDDFSRSKSPTKLFEYMACGKPTVATDFGEAPRFVEHGVTAFIAATEEDFATCCTLLLNDPELRKRMGRNARRKIETEYNISAAASKLSEILNLRR